MSQTRKMTRSVKNVTLSTLLSRVLGYIRDMLIASEFGHGMMADAFYVAYRIPNLLRHLLGEGALSSSFIPVFTEYLTNKTEEEAKELVSILATLLFVVLAFLTIIGITFAPFIVRVIAPGFSDNPQKLSLAVTLTRIMFPFMLFIGLAALALGILNSLRKFAIPALAPCVLNISQIVFVLAVCPLLAVPVKGIAYGVLVGGFGQLVFQAPSIIRSGFFPRIKIVLSHPGIRRIGVMMLPAVIGLSVHQVNIFVDTMCASLLEEGSVTALYYANRLMQLPLALFGIAIATVTFPSMSKSAAQQDMAGLKKTLVMSLRMVLFTIIPASVGLMVIGKPIVKLLFERNHFTAAGTDATSWALLFYSTGIFAYAGVKILVNAFYSLKDTKTPVKIAAVAMVLNAVLNIILMRFLNVGGLALATAIASILNMFILITILRSRLGLLGFRSIMSLLWRVVVASGVMAAFCYYMTGILAGLGGFFQVALTITGAVFVFVLICVILKVEEIKHVKELIFPEQVSGM
ncbi:MAG: murein biosynthesis integral membrane protein MurJ [bacterium]